MGYWRDDFKIPNLPMFVALDQEGGRPGRDPMTPAQGVTAFPSPMAAGVICVVCSHMYKGITCTQTFRMQGPAQEHHSEAKSLRDPVLSDGITVVPNAICKKQLATAVGGSESKELIRAAGYSQNALNAGTASAKRKSVFSSTSPIHTNSFAIQSYH